MPKLNSRYPKNCRDRNQAFSWYNGKRIYHGAWGSPEAKKSYDRFIAALLENPTLPLRMGADGVLISELAAGFVEYVESRNMDKTDVGHFKRAVGFLVEVYGKFSVNEFSPKKLKAVRNQMVKAGTLSRPMINLYVRKIRSVFSWGTEEEVVNSNVVHAIREVKALRKGEQGTFEPPPRKNVPDDVVRRTLPFLPATVSAMIQIQRMLGTRPSEVFNMRVGDIDRTRGNGLWYYVPAHHKTEQHIGEKPMPLGKPEQKILAPFLEGKTAEQAIFSPAQAQAERNAERRANRKTKRTPSQKMRDAKRAAKPKQYREFYDKHTYNRAVAYAITKANRHLQEGEKPIPKWSPYALRHAAATETSRTAGKDKAKALLAHRSIRTTEIYDHSDLEVREELARKRVNPFEPKSDDAD